MAWPRLAVDDWADTRDTLHMWAQIVGKVRLALAPMINLWWQSTFYVDARGFTTSLIPWRDGGFEVAFDFQRHVLDITTVDGASRELALTSRSVAEFYREFFDALGGVGIDVEILARPVEVEVAIPFPEDTVHATYDPNAAATFWRLLVNAERVMTEFRSRYPFALDPFQDRDGVGQARVARIEQINLGRVAGHHHPRALAEASQDHLHLQARAVLRLVDDDEGVAERAPAHEGDRRHLDLAAVAAPAQRLPAHQVGQGLPDGREIGIDLSNRKPKKIDLEMQLHADKAITLNCQGDCP